MSSIKNIENDNLNNNNNSNTRSNSIDSSRSDDSNRFSPNRLFDAFQKSIIYDENEKAIDVKLKEYLLAYEEIVKFFDYLGSVFYFVVADVKEKLVLLKDYMAKNEQNYKTILKIVNYEKENKIYKNKGNNASRHILRLHRALIFIYKFLDRLYQSDHKNKSSTICSEVYEITLAKHHSWIVRKAATLGMLTLPSHEVLVHYMLQSSDDKTNFPMFIQSVEAVYDTTQRIYEKLDFLDLP